MKRATNDSDKKFLISSNGVPTHSQLDDLKLRQNATKNEKFHSRYLLGIRMEQRIAGRLQAPLRKSAVSLVEDVTVESLMLKISRELFIKN